MTTFLKLCAATIVAFPALDAYWTGLVARNFHREQMGNDQRARREDRSPGGRAARGRLT